MPDIERRNRATGDDVAGAGLYHNRSDSCHKSRCRKGLPLDCGNPFRGACQGVLSYLHRRRSGMCCSTFKRQFCPALTCDHIDDSEWKVEVLENGKLLDVELEIADMVHG